MSTFLYEFEGLSTRESFNRSLKHFSAAGSIMAQMEQNYNLADILNVKLIDKTIEANQINTLVYALLVTKYLYQFRSFNCAETIDEFEKIAEETAKWKAVDLVISYIHPELGYIVINPKNKESWKDIKAIRKNEILTIFAGALTKTPESYKNPKTTEIYQNACEKLYSLLTDKKCKTDELKKGNVPFKILAAPKPVKPKLQTKPKSKTVKKTTLSASAQKTEPVKPALPPAPAATGAKKKMFGPYSVAVTNELFHNGNVEAWKRIIQSYTVKYPNCEVYVFYDGERIHDINTLFKWGKVKSGTSILFSIAGDDVKDVSKLQRYLFQGASPRFEDFLRFPVGQVLGLF